MPNPQWPAGLQQYVSTDSFEYRYGKTTLRTDMDTGLAKVRRRFTRSVDMVQGAIDLPMEDFSTFDFFYRTTVNGGATVFDFPHPITRLPVAVRFLEEPSIRAKGGTTFTVSMSLEVMP